VRSESFEAESAGAAAWVLLEHYELTRFLFFGVEARFEKKSDKLMSSKVILETYP
jgi:hypothetical protein